MKAYQIIIELEHTDPVVWRRVVAPAGATFKRMHDIIQIVTNFQGGYPSDGYHLYEFYLEDDNIIVTNDEQAYDEAVFLKKNPDILKKEFDRISDLHIEAQEAIGKRLKAKVYKPTGIKINKYLEKQGKLYYSYDFGDDWHFIVTLEDIIYDYPYGYPQLIDGECEAPPEDVGGIPGFYEFLRAYYTKKPSSEQKELARWGKSIGFREYDPEHINIMLKSIKYK